jgi:ParB-like chromosome segregation protein Spo0J
MKKLEVKKLSEIYPYENNPRNNDIAVDDVVESIEQCTYIAPIIVDENNVILAGHTRYKALKQLGESEVEVIVQTGLSEEQKQKYRVLDNKTGEKAEWDFEKLDAELEGLDFGGYDFGFDLDDLGKELSHQQINSGKEIQIDEYGDENFKHECPRCGFKFN